MAVMKAAMRRFSSNGHVPLSQRIVCSVMAQEGHGKTDFWTTAPKPILAVSVDANTEPVVQKVFKQPSRDLDPDIATVVHVPFPLVGFEMDEDHIARQATDAWDLLTDTLRPIIEGRAKVMPKTVALDTGTELNDLNILAEFGRTAKISPKTRLIKMGNVNARFKGIFRGLEHAGVHVVITHRVKEKWEMVEVRGRSGIEEKDQRVPGEFERIGFRQMGNMVNVEVLLLFDPSRSEKLPGKFGMRITRSMIRPALIGGEFWGREVIGDERVRCASFPYLATLLYPDSHLQDWT